MDNDHQSCINSVSRTRTDPFIGLGRGGWFSGGTSMVDDVEEFGIEMERDGIRLLSDIRHALRS